MKNLTIVVDYGNEVREYKRPFINKGGVYIAENVGFALNGYVKAVKKGGVVDTNIPCKSIKVKELM